VTAAPAAALSSLSREVRDNWLKADELFLSNFSGFSIFSLEVFTWFAGCSALSGTCAAAIPAPTSLAISSGVSIVATCAHVGSLVPGGGLPVARVCTYRSSSSPLGGGEGEGEAEGEPASRSGPCGGPVPPPPVVPTAGNSGSGGLDGGMAGRLCLRVAGVGASRIWLRRTGCLGKGGGAVGADAALVLGILAGLRQSCSGSGEGALGLGDPGRGICGAIRWISSLARRNSSSTLLIFL